MSTTYKIINSFYRITKCIQPACETPPVVIDQGDACIFDNWQWAKCAIHDQVKTMLSTLNNQHIESIYKCDQCDVRPIFRNSNELIVRRWTDYGCHDIARFHIHIIDEAIGDNASIAYHYRGYRLLEHPSHKTNQKFNLYDNRVCIAEGLSRNDAFHMVDCLTDMRQPPYANMSNDNHLQVEIPGGHLVTTLSQDPDYPGIDIEFVAFDDIGDTASRPRVLVEKPIDGNLRALIWNNPASEDYTEEIDMINPLP